MDSCPSGQLRVQWPQKAQRVLSHQRNKWGLRVLGKTHEEKKIIETYIDMLQGTMSLQAATESGYPQSWACLVRHADSLCRGAWFIHLFKQAYSRDDAKLNSKLSGNLLPWCWNNKVLSALFIRQEVPMTARRGATAGPIGCEQLERGPEWRTARVGHVTTPGPCPLPANFGNFLTVMTSATF